MLQTVSATIFLSWRVPAFYADFKLYFKSTLKQSLCIVLGLEAEARSDLADVNKILKLDAGLLQPSREIETFLNGSRSTSKFSSAYW